MNMLFDFFQTTDFLQFAVKALGFVAMFLLVIVVIFIIVNKIRRKRRYATTIPYHGETRGGKVYCTLTDPLFTSFRESGPDSVVGDHIKIDLDSDLDSLIGIRYHAISRNGRFLIILRGSEYWVEPEDVDDEYDVHVRRKEAVAENNK